VNSGFLREKEMDMWRAAAGDPYLMEMNPDEIPMFERFVERGLALPASDFFKGLLKYYGIEYLNLNSNEIFHVSVFIHFCDIVERMGRIFKDMPPYTPCPVPEYSAARPPNKVGN
jgi:hypothetical protein